MMSSKKQSILLVLKILESESSKERPMTQVAIADLISKVYLCDRKTVCRNIKTLITLGYPIVKTTKGFYMESRAFSPEEIAFVQPAILQGDGKSDSEREALSEAVCAILRKQYRR